MESIIMEGKIVALERISDIEEKVTIEFIMPNDEAEDYIDKFKEDEPITFQKPNMEI